MEEDQERKIINCKYIPVRKTLKVNKIKEGEQDEVTVVEKTKQEKGFYLEELIFTASLKLPGLVHSFRENDIKKHFNESSLNGIDHLIKIGETNILLQDKWKESHNQQEVSQFLNCCSRIQERLGTTVQLIWASKCTPTKNSLKMLKERKVHILVSDNMEELANSVIKKILEMVSDDIMKGIHSSVLK